VTNSSHSAQTAPNGGGANATGVPTLSELTALIAGRSVIAELRGVGDPAVLTPGEARFVGKAVPKRRQEFAAGRACARRALQEYGLVDPEILVAADRQAIWPPGFIGSITHTGGFCAAVVAQRHALRAVGLDSEVLGDVGQDIWHAVCGQRELSRLENLPAERRAALATVIFSAKEAFYKCQYPLTGEWLDFHDLELSFEPSEGTDFEIVIRATRPISFERHCVLPMTARCRLHGRYVTVAVALQ
jgi:4'-phosphopantetheinyl transferase EntD